VVTTLVVKTLVVTTLVVTTLVVKTLVETTRSACALNSCHTGNPASLRSLLFFVTSHMQAGVRAVCLSTSAGRHSK
jgi:hypothetical protein